MLHTDNFHSDSLNIDATTVDYENGFFIVRHLMSPVFKTRDGREAEQVKLKLMQRDEADSRIPTVYA